MVNAWSSFGGISAQLNLVALILNMAIVEHAGVAIAYDIALRKYASQLARQRRTDIDFVRLLSEENADIKKQVYANQRNSGKGEDTERNKRKGKGKGERPNAYHQTAHSSGYPSSSNYNNFPSYVQSNRFQKSWIPRKTVSSYRPFQKQWQGQNRQPHFYNQNRHRNNERSKKRSTPRSSKRSRSRQAKSARRSSKKKSRKEDEKKWMLCASINWTLISYFRK